MHPLIQVLVAVLVLVAGAYDIRYRRIPNWLVLPCWVVGFAVNVALAGWPGLKNAALGFGLALLVYVPLFMRH
jgi:prepilin peptidase CpaA